MVETYTLIGAVLAYIGLHVHLYLASKPLKSLELLPQHDKEHTEFIIEKAISASKNAGQLCRLCGTCKRVVHKYDLSGDGTVLCHDCKVPS